MDPRAGYPPFFVDVVRARSRQGGYALVPLFEEAALARTEGSGAALSFGQLFELEFEVINAVVAARTRRSRHRMEGFPSTCPEPV